MGTNYSQEQGQETATTHLDVRNVLLDFHEVDACRCAYTNAQAYRVHHWWIHRHDDDDDDDDDDDGDDDSDVGGSYTVRDAVREGNTRAIDRQLRRARARAVASGSGGDDHAAVLAPPSKPTTSNGKRARRDHRAGDDSDDGDVIDLT